MPRDSYKIVLQRKFPSDLISLVLDMYEHGSIYKEIVTTINIIFPTYAFTARDIRKIVKAYKGEVLQMEKGGESMTIRFDQEVANFLHELPYPPSDFVNAIMGIYIREYKLKKSQEKQDE